MTERVLHDLIVEWQNAMRRADQFMDLLARMQALTGIRESTLEDLRRLVADAKEDETRLRAMVLREGRGEGGMGANRPHGDAGPNT